MPSTRSYPIFLHLAGRSVLIVGGGAVALRKARGLVEAGASVTLIAPEFAPEFAAMAPGGGARRIKKIRRAYASSDMKEEYVLVFAATDSPAVNRRVYHNASGKGILCCRCDDTDHSDFAGAAVATAGGVTIAVSTSSASPALSARIRDQAAAAIEPALAQLAELLPAWRARVKKVIAHPDPRRQLLQMLSGSHMEEILRDYGPAHAQKLFAQWLKNAGSWAPAPLKITRGPRRPPTRTSRHAH